MRRALLGAALLATACQSVGSQSIGPRPPLQAFRGIPWGAPRAEVERRMPDMVCDADTYCVGTVVLEGVPVRLVVELGGRGVSSFSLHYPPPAFPKMKALFTRWYGSPDEDTPGWVSWTRRIRATLSSDMGTISPP